MNVSSRFIVVAVVFASCTYPDEPIAEAVARLQPVEAGTLDALTGEAVRDLCLDASQYVLAFERAPGADDGFASILPLPENDLAADASFIEVLPESQQWWAWDAFTVDEDACLEFHVRNGRARVLELFVGVAW